MTWLETYRGMVTRPNEDHMGHMNVAFYTGKFDEATWQFFGAIGLTNRYIRSENKGMAALTQTTNYKAEVTAGDLLVIRTRLLDISEKKIRFFHSMENCETGQEVATTELMGVHFDRKARKSCPFPKDILEKGQSLMSQQPT
ncbi:acyl-CoA thioesterase [Cohaesibacter gelatinilyticus]|uniref:Acyl-CoA thioester hydrolase n=1 Tax=Cohaesibacter gelatinilyticus TaxID=372072 RepID=A0A285NB00_9HYPH|nr:thioesterase family protein [Cohaesibacter gelatinilyticus]SNZ06488.1 acyl-CoA thioester hydrolase [Cohaesibacter gelatinilyticus]HAT88071.1 thioesterase [Hyphomicrobiales bacterium]